MLGFFPSIAGYEQWAGSLICKIGKVWDPFGADWDDPVSPSLRLFTADHIIFVIIFSR